jgi:hypothetical protein
MHGWWQYFPVAFILKTPLTTLLLTAVVVGVFLFLPKRRRRTSDELTLALFPLTYGALSLTSTINIGYRHLLPILPFLFVWLSRLTHHASRITHHASRITHHVLRFTFHVSRLTFYALLLYHAIIPLLLSPHYLAYFNPIAGGPDQGYRFLADSNTDWGQALKALAEHQQRNDLGPVKLSLFTFLDPATYGVRYEPIAPMRDAPPVLPRRFDPGPGLYAVSATTLDGVPLPLPSTYDWFRHRAPLAKIGHVMFLYQVERSQTSWVAQCTVPAVPLPAQAMAEGFGSDRLRGIHFDCEGSWIFPGGGASDGWYARATPGIDALRWPAEGERLEWWPAWMVQLPLTSLRLSYVQPTPAELPAFAIWEWSSTPVAPPATIAGGEIALDGTLVFLGYDAPQTATQDTSADVLTYWRVVEQPSRPLSLMLHLIDEGGAPVAVGDGLGIPVDQWRPGDVIVQRHTLAIPTDAPPGEYVVHSGAYWLDDMTRLTVEGEGSIPLAPLKIQ